MRTIAAPKVFALFFLIFVSFSIAAAQSGSQFTLPAGTRLTLRTEHAINSRFSSVNDTFKGVVAKPVEIGESIVLPADTVFAGHVTGASPAGLAGRSGRLEFSIDRLEFGSGESRSIEGVLAEELGADSDGPKALLGIAGGIGAGTLIGGVAGKGRGALIGAGIGAGIGTGIAIFRKGRDVGLDAEEEFEIVLTKEVTLPARGY